MWIGMCYTLGVDRTCFCVRLRSWEHFSLVGLHIFGSKGLCVVLFSLDMKSWERRFEGMKIEMSFGYLKFEVYN